MDSDRILKMKFRTLDFLKFCLTTQKLVRFKVNSASKCLKNLLSVKKIGDVIQKAKP